VGFAPLDGFISKGIWIHLGGSGSKKE
jgi:hypothetical protein